MNTLPSKLDFDWDLLRSFLAVLDQGSLSAAARALGASQPTLGRHIASLETQLGVTLFTRSGGRLAPSEAALEIAEAARTMHAAAAQVSLRATGQSGTLSGPVRVTASEVVATYALPGLLGPLLQMEPELEIEIVASNSTENLALREADIAVRMHRPQQADLIAKKIGAMPVGLFAHHSYLKSAPPLRGPEDLGAHVFLGYDSSDLLIRGMAAMGIDVSRRDFRMRMDDQVTYAEAIAAGAGIGATTHLPFKGREDVVQIMPELSIPPIPVWIAAHRELRTSARVRRVFDHLAEGLKAFCS